MSSACGVPGACALASEQARTWRYCIRSGGKITNYKFAKIRGQPLGRRRSQYGTPLSPSENITCIRRERSVSRTTATSAPPGNNSCLISCASPYSLACKAFSVIWRDTSWLIWSSGRPVVSANTRLMFSWSTRMDFRASSSSFSLSSQAGLIPLPDNQLFFLDVGIGRQPGLNIDHWPALDIR